MRYAPEHPTNKALQRDVPEFDDSGCATDRRQIALVPVLKWRWNGSACRTSGNDTRNVLAHLFRGRRDPGHGVPIGNDGCCVADSEDIGVARDG